MRIGLSLVGQFVGGIFGQSQLGASLGSMVGGLAEGLFVHRDPEVIEGPRPGEVHVPSASYGTPIPWYWGSMRGAGNVIAGPYVDDVRTEEEVGGGGGFCGGGPEQVQVTWTRYATFAVSLCRGPITRINRIWANNRLIYDMSDTAGKAVQMDGLNMTLYPGNETQDPDPSLEAEEGAGNVPAFRGQAVAVFYRMPWSDFGNNMPVLNFDIQVDASASSPVVGIETDSLENDNILRTPDGQWVLCERNNVWKRFNVANGELTNEITYNTDPIIPGAYHDHHDTDELGNIYTAKDVGAANYNAAAKLDIDLNHTGTGETLSATRICAVIRNSRYPYVWYGRTTGGGVYVLLRETLLPVGGPTLVQIDPPTGKDIEQFAIDHENGVVYALYSGGGDSIVRKYNATGSTYVEYDLSAYIYEAGFIAFDPVSDQVILGSTYDLAGGASYTPVAFFDGSDLSHLGTLQQDLISAYNYSGFQNGVHNGNLYTSYSDGVRKINVNSQAVSTYDTETPTSGDQRGLVYDQICNAVWGIFGSAAYTLYKCLLDRGTGDTVTLSTIVSDICGDVDLAAGDIDVTDLTDEVRGYKIDARMPARQAIQPLMDTFFFDGVESDTKLKFVKRGGASAASIAEADLAAHPDGQQRPQTLPRPIRQEVELPVQVDVTYINPDAEYQFNNQRTRKLTTNSSDLLNLRLPVVLSDDEAKQISYTHLSMAWLERFMYSFQLGREYFYLEPTDVVTITYNSDDHVVRITDMRYEGGVLAVEAVKEDATICSNSFTGAAAPTHAPEVHYPGPSSLEIVDCPALEDAQDMAGLYLAACGYSAYWRGCAVYKSPDGAGWTQFALMNVAATMGRCTDALADFNYTRWDDGNSVNLRLTDSDATLSSCTKAQGLEGANAALIGDEIINFTTATAEADGSYTLTGLLRGRRGTEWARSTHSVGDRFILLAVPGIFFEEIGLSDENVARFYKGVSIGQIFAKGVDRSVTALIRTLMPYSPDHISGARDGSSNLTITWLRRTRIGGHWADSHDVPLSEDFEAYEVDILDVEGNVLRTIEDLDSETATYSATNQASDGPFYAFGRYNIDDADSGSSNFPSSNGKSCCRFQTPSIALSVTGLMVYYTTAEAAAKAKAIIYDDNAEDANNLVAEGTEVVGIEEGWNLLPFGSPVSLDRLTCYHIGVISDTTLVTVPFNNTGINCWNVDIYNGAADPFGAVSNSTTGKPIYAVTQHADVDLPVQVFQLSDDVGRGFAGEATI